MAQFEAGSVLRVSLWGFHKVSYLISKQDQLFFLLLPAMRCIGIHFKFLNHNIEDMNYPETVCMASLKARKEIGPWVPCEML